MKSMNRVNARLGISFAIIFFAMCSIGCKKLVQVDPPTTSITGASVYGSDATAIATMTGMYAQMSNTGIFIGSSGISLLAGLSADEWTLYSGAATTDTKFYYYKNSLSINPAYGSEFWGILYNYIFACNSTLEGLNNSTALTPAVKQQLLGEAKFMRGFCYFYLVNFFGDVPLALSSDYTANAQLSRTAKALVYQQIIADLRDAQNLLVDGYVKADGITLYPSNAPEKVRPNKYAASALLARTYLYDGNWSGADSAASVIINNSIYSLGALAGANSVFNKNSSEAIWQLQPVNAGHNTEDAWLFIISSTGPSSSYPVYLSNSLLNSFESGDQRKTNGNWINSVTVSGTTYYYPYKYKSATLNAPVTEYTMVFRLGEQYLIRAEARAQLGNISGSQTDLNTIRSRAGLPATTATDKASLLTAILHERQVELFTEWGNRWLDLKRTGTVDLVMGAPGNACAAKGGTWNTNQQLYPILLTDVQKDVNLTQNPGY